jgi:hypothetical protein
MQKIVFNSYQNKSFQFGCKLLNINKEFQEDKNNKIY